MSPLEVVFIAANAEEASTRVRIGQVLPRLEGESVRGRLAVLPRRSSGRWAFFRGLSEADVVVVHRKLFGRLEFAFLRRNARRLVFDFDDAVMMRDSFQAVAPSRRRAARFANTVRKADAVIAGNLYLKDRALEAGARGEVRVIASAVDPARYPPGETREIHPVVLGWIGSRVTLPYLEDVLPSLEILASATPPCSLRIIADAFPATRELPVDSRPWSEAEEGKLLASIDIGLMPLRDDAWARGKCGYKILQYFAARKPVIASPVGVNPDLVLPGVTGLLASTAGEWAESAARLATEPDTRHAMGRSGFALLEREGYTLEAYTAALGALLREVAS